MCTLTWCKTPERYDLFFNRDEKRSRRPGLPPSVFRKGNLSFLAPVDGDSGGSWMGVNEFGVSVAILNAYPAGFVDEEKPYASRGLLLPEVIDARSSGDIEGRLRSLKLNSFRPFSLAVFGLNSSPSLFTWNGVELEVKPLSAERGILSSSSYLPEKVTGSRSEAFIQLSDRQWVDASVLRNFHCGHDSRRGAFSVCLHRQDAKTVSFSWLSLSYQEGTFRYYPGSPCGIGNNPENEAHILKLPIQLPQVLQRHAL